MAQKQKTPKKEYKNIPNGIVNIGATFNNTIITVTNLDGDVICWCSSGMMGFKGSRKSTPYAAKLVGETVMKEALNHGMKNVEIRIKGPGSGRESALRSIASSGLRVIKIVDITPVPHNGCRPPKRRRI